MKTRRLLPFLAGLVLSTGLAPQIFASPSAKSDRVTVNFQDPDRFTDVFENNSSTTSQYYLDELKSCLQESAARQIGADQRLEITVTDVDLAGDTTFNQPDRIRIMKDIYSPRVQLKFQLLAADGKVLKEGTRHLSDPFYLYQIRMPGNQDPLYYDKALLKQWVRDEFRAKA